MARLVSCLIVLACLTACLRHRPANSDCEWPNDTRAGVLDLSQPSDMQHLSEDAEFAEDLAIRYADARRGPDYLQTRGECMERLFGTVAKNHGVTGEQVRASLGRRRLSFDAVVILSFAVLYGLAASLLTRWLCRLYGPEEGLPTVAVMTVFAGLIASGVGVLLGEVWSWTWEAYRLGYNHMSYRVTRIPWTLHRLELFLGGIVLFLTITAFHRRHSSQQRA